MSGAATMRARLADLQPTSTFSVSLLSVVTAVGMCRVFDGWAFLVPLLVVVLAVHLVAALLRAAHLPTPVAFVVLCGVVVEVVALTRHGATTNFGLPSGDTIAALRADLRAVADQFPSAVPPVAEDEGWGTSLSLLLGCTAVIADLFAARGSGRLEVLTPNGSVFVVVAVLGSDRNRLAVAALWIAAALLVVGVLRFRETSSNVAWMGGRSLRPVAALPALALVAAVSAAAGSFAAPSIPGAYEDGWIEGAGIGGASVTEVVSPLVDIGSRLRTGGEQELFSVESSDGGHYWRLIGLSDYDGTVWQPVEEDLGPVGAVSPGVPVTSVGQTIRIEALGGHLVPAAHRPVQVSPDVIAWASESESLVLPESELQRGDTIAVVSQIPVPQPELLRSVGVSSAPPDEFLLPAGVSVRAVETAVAVTSGATTPYDKALALQEWFRTNFEYDLEVDYGNSTDAIARFLDDRRGFCQQFAGTFAVMARSIGLPARVAVGFTSGELGADGRYHVYGRHAHAWPEVWFDGVGWVSFEPTPGRGNADTQIYTGVAPAQDDDTTPDLSTTTTVVTSTTTPDDPSATTTTLPGDSVATTVPTGAEGSGQTSTASGGGWTGPLRWLAAIVAVVLAWMLLAPRAVAASLRRGHRDPGARVADSWRRTVAVLGLLGAPRVGGCTPDEYARLVAERLDEHPSQIDELASRVVVAVYAPGEIDASTAADTERLADDVVDWVRERLRPLVRLRWSLDPWLMRRSLGR